MAQRKFMFELEERVRFRTYIHADSLEEAEKILHEKIEFDLIDINEVDSGGLEVVGEGEEVLR